MIEREPNEYAKPLIIDGELSDINSLGDLIHAIGQELEGEDRNSRYHEINLLAFLKHGTIEVRRFSGTTEESQISASISMIAAMAKEAKTRTNQIFDENLKKPMKPKTAEDKDILPLSFVQQQQTERKTELFKLRVKQVHESHLEILTSEQAAELKESKNTDYAKNIIYVSANSTDGLDYIFYDKNGVQKIGTIENDKKFGGIIKKIHSKQPLDLSEEYNQLLYEVAVQAGALISHPIEKLKPIINAQLHTFFSTHARGEAKQAPEEINPKDEAIEPDKAHPAI